MSARADLDAGERADLRAASLVTQLSDRLPRPLDRIRSIKLKLAVLMTFSGGLAFAWFSQRIGWLPPMTTLTAMLIALVSSQFLAHGITTPLREMTAAAQRMAHGDYTSRVRAPPATRWDNWPTRSIGWRPTSPPPTGSAAN